jgi:hypothetical protein
VITSAAQQLSSLRKLYAKAHHQLQDAGQVKLVLEDRIRVLEARVLELESQLPLQPRGFTEK